MASITDILHPEDITSLQHLQLFARTVVEGFTTGLHASPHKGFSVEFRQHRPYVQGDEIKRLDWKIFGRSDRFYIREYDAAGNPIDGQRKLPMVTNTPSNIESTPAIADLGNGNYVVAYSDYVPANDGGNATYEIMRELLELSADEIKRLRQRKII